MNTYRPAASAARPDLAEALVRAGASVHAAPPGAVAFNWRGRPEAFILVTSGRLAVRFRPSASSSLWAECRAGAGQDCMPVTAAILSDGALAVRAACLTPTTWLRLSPASLLQMVHGDIAFRRALFAQHARRLPFFFARTLGPGSCVDERLARWLLGHGEEGRVLATHQRIAADLITAREVVSRRLRAFADHGVIQQRRGEITLAAPVALVRIADGQPGW